MTHTKDPNSLLDFGVDWSSWLASGETISTSEWDVPAGLTEGASTESDGITTVWLSGGTAGTTYRVRNRVSTSASRVDDRSFFVRCADR